MKKWKKCEQKLKSWKSIQKNLYYHQNKWVFEGKEWLGYFEKISFNSAYENAASYKSLQKSSIKCCVGKFLKYQKGEGW